MLDQIKLGNLFCRVIVFKHKFVLFCPDLMTIKQNAYNKFLL